MTPVTRLRGDERDELRHAFLDTFPRVLSYLPRLRYGSFHDFRDVRYRQEAVLLTKWPATAGTPGALQWIPRTMVGVVCVLRVVC